MIPILYDKTETSFTSNGLGRLASCTRCIVTEERNGGYECEFDFPINDPKYELIQEGQIIAVTHDDNGDIQPFDIYHRTAPLNGVVTFYAKHISYRLNGIVVSPFTASGVANAIAGLKTNSIGANPFTFSTDKTTSGEYTVSVPSTLRALLGGEENSLIDVFGTGEYEFDKFNVKLWLHRGSDTDVQIRYGKNLYDIEHDIDYSDSYNGVVPFWYNTDPTSEAEDPPMILVTASPVYASGTTYDGRNTVAPLDLTQDFQDAIPTSAELTTLATAKLNASDTLLPIENITVSFVQLWQTEEYASIAPLQQVKLCDTVTIVYPELGINGIRSKVIKVVYNTLLDRYDEIELGDALTNYAALITSDTRSALADLEDGLVMIKGAAQQAVHDADTARTAATAAEAAAGNALTAAGLAQTAATNAGNAATVAQNAADAAQRDATSANISANAALDQLGIVQDVVGVLEWASDHGTFALTQDQTIQDGKVYFTYDSGTGDYVPVVNPQQSELSTYYELSMDEAMQSFIMAHLAVTSRGLWVLPNGMASETTPATGETQADSDARQGNDYKVLLANDGMYVYNGSGVMVGKYGSTAQIGVTGSTRFVINAGNLQAYDSAGNKYFEVSSSGLTFGSNTAATISDIDSAIEGLVDIKTSTGSVVSVSDASPYPAIDVQAEIAPSQPNKYDSVWVGGAGKNLLNYNTWKTGTAVNATQVWENNGVTLTATANDAYTGANISVPISEGETLTLAWEETTNRGGNCYIFPNGTTTGMVSGNNASVKKISYTATSGITYITFRLGVSGTGNVISYKNVQIVKGTTVPTWTPYENICPISGFSSVKVSRTGKNLLGGSAFKNSVLNNVPTSSLGSNTYGSYVTWTANSTTTQKVIADDVFKANTQYTFIGKFAKNDTNASVNLCFYYTDGTYTSFSYRSSITANVPFTIAVSSTSGKTIASLKTNWAGGTTYAFYDEIGVFEGVLTSADFEAYQGDTYTIDLGGNVYSGTLDVTTGTLTVTHGYKDLGTLTWGYNSTYQLFYNSLTDGVKNENSNIHCVCSQYRAVVGYNPSGGINDITQDGVVSVGSSYVSTTSNLLIRDKRYTDATAFKNALTSANAQLVYELATPQTYNLTAAEVEMLTGANNLWSSTGDIDLEYASMSDNMLALAEQTSKSNKFITQIGSDGIKVHAEDNIDQNYAKIDANGMEVYKGGTSVAMYGDYARIGLKDDARLEIAPNEMQMIMDSGHTAFRLAGSGINRTITTNVSINQYVDIGASLTVDLSGILAGSEIIVEVDYADLHGNYQLFTLIAGTSSSGTKTATNYPHFSYSYNGSTYILTINANQGEAIFVRKYSTIKTVEIGAAEIDRAQITELLTNGSDATVGKIESDTDSIGSWSAGATNIMSSVTLSKGRWVLCGQVDFYGSTSSYRRICISENTTCTNNDMRSGAGMQVSASNAGSTVLQVTLIEQVTTSKSYYLTAISGAALSGTSYGKLTAICVG